MRVPNASKVIARTIARPEDAVVLIAFVDGRRRRGIGLDIPHTQDSSGGRVSSHAERGARDTPDTSRALAEHAARRNLESLGTLGSERARFASRCAPYRRR